MNILAIHIPCWLIPILVGLLCAILGYLLGRLLGKKGDRKEEEDYRIKIEKLETSLKSCTKQKANLQEELDACKRNKQPIAPITNSDDKLGGMSSSFSNAIPLIPFDAAAAKLAFGKKIKENDLKIVEGIGPKIEELFNSFDIKTWKSLSETSVERCQEILLSGGERFRMHNPGTWPQQAKLAYEGKWKELVKWQDELDGGKA